MAPTCDLEEAEEDEVWPGVSDVDNALDVGVSLELEDVLDEVGSCDVIEMEDAEAFARTAGDSTKL